MVGGRCRQIESEDDWKWCLGCECERYCSEGASALPPYSVPSRSSDREYSHRLCLICVHRAPQVRVRLARASLRSPAVVNAVAAPVSAGALTTSRPCLSMEQYPAPSYSPSYHIGEVQIIACRQIVNHLLSRHCRRPRDPYEYRSSESNRGKTSSSTA